MRFVHTNLRVRDIDASLRFYEALGFERRGKLQFEGAYNVYLGLPGDGDTLELTVNEGRDEPYDLGTGYGHIALVLADLDEMAARPPAPPPPPPREAGPRRPAAGNRPEKAAVSPGRPRRRRPDLLPRRPGR